MRIMSFSTTVDQIRKETKTVTRRLGWKFLKPGDEIMAVVKCLGLRKGDKIEKIRPLSIVNVNRQVLYLNISEEEVIKEGFPDMSSLDFVKMFCKINKCDEFVELTRIEFKYIPILWNYNPKDPLTKWEELKLFEMNEVDVVIARSKKEAEDWYRGEYDGENDEGAEEVKSYKKRHWWIIRDMNHLRDIINKFGKMEVGNFAGDIAVFISYENSMKLYDSSVPEIFSSTE